MKLNLSQAELCQAVDFWLRERVMRLEDGVQVLSVEPVKGYQQDVLNTVLHVVVTTRDQLPCGERL